MTTLSDRALALTSKLTRPILDEIKDAIDVGGEWQLHTAADHSMVIVNRVLNDVSEQWIFYLESNTWGRASYPARAWHNLSGKTQFTDINGELQTAKLRTGWFRLGASGLASITPTILAKGPVSVRVAVLTDHNETASDLAEAWQVVSIEPENVGADGETVSLCEEIGLDACGDVYQLRMEVTATWAQLVHIGVMAE